MTPKQLVNAHSLMIQRIAKAHAAQGSVIEAMVKAGSLSVHEVALIGKPEKPLPFDLVVKVLSFGQSPADLISLPFSPKDVAEAMAESVKRAKLSNITGSDR